MTGVDLHNSVVKCKLLCVRIHALGLVSLQQLLLCRHKLYACCTDARNPVESCRPAWVLNVQGPIVFTAISTQKWALKAFHTNLFPQRSTLSLVLSKVVRSWDSDCLPLIIGLNWSSVHV